MAIAISGTVGSATSNTSGTTLALTFTAAQSGAFSILCLAYDPSGSAVPTVTVSDTASNTWTSLGAYSAPATTSAGTGVITEIFTSTTAVSGSTTTVTATFSAAITGKVGRLFTFTGTNGATGIVRNTVRGTAQDLTSSLTSVASGDLVLAWGGWEQTGTVTATSTTTSGTWVPSNTTVTAVSSGGTGAANILGYYQYKITTATATQAHTVQNNSSGNCALQYIKVLQLANTTVSRTATGSGTGTATTLHTNTQLRLNALTDFTFPYRFGGRFYLGYATVVCTASGSGLGTAATTSIEVLPRTATGSGLGTQTATGVKSKLATASGFGLGTQTATGLHTAPRTATASGAGTQTSNGLHVAPRTATGSGAGTSSASYLVTPGVNAVSRTASGSGAGTQSASGLHIAPRTATGSGTGTSATTQLSFKGRSATGSGVGTSSVTYLITRLRTASASGTGTATSIALHVVIRTSTGNGLGTSSGIAYITRFRTASGSGTGTSSASGGRLKVAVGTANGTGTSTLSDWTKSHIFRIPADSKVRYARKYYDGTPDALFAHTPKGARAKNLYRLTDGTYTTTDPRRPEMIEKLYLGGHDNFLSDQEVAQLTAAGYGSYIT